MPITNQVPNREIAEMAPNAGGYGAAIKARSARLMLVEERLEAGKNIHGAPLSAQARARLTIDRDKLISELDELDRLLRELHEKRKAARSARRTGKFTAQGAPSSPSKITDWE